MRAGRVRLIVRTHAIRCAGGSGRRCTRASNRVETRAIVVVPCCLTTGMGHGIRRLITRMRTGTRVVSEMGCSRSSHPLALDRLERRGLEKKGKEGLHSDVQTLYCAYL